MPQAARDGIAAAALRPIGWARSLLYLLQGRSAVKPNPHVMNARAIVGNVDAIETVSRRMAREVMISVVDTLVTETGASRPRIVKVLKQEALDANHPDKLELIFDLIAALELGADSAFLRTR
jgi:hypothetical protein